MVKDIVLVVIPAIASAIITFLLEKNSKKRKSKSVSTNSFLSFTHWVYVNMFKLLILDAAFAFLFFGYVVYGKLFTYLPVVSPVVIPAVYVVNSFIIFIYIIDILFYPDVKK